MKTQTKRKESATQYPDITRILTWNDVTGKWVEPVRGKKFKARRYVKRANGTLRRIKRSFETLAEAKIFRGGTTNDVAEKELAPKPKAKMTFAELVEAWRQDWLPNKDLSTQIRYKSYLKKFHIFSDMVVDEIEPTHVDKWIAQMKRPENLALGHSTRCSFDHEFSVLRVILNFYSSRFNRNYRLPFLKDHKAMLKVKSKPAVRKDLTVDQLKAFIAALKELCWGTKWEAIYYLALMQYGIYGRVQDAAALHYEDFDTVNNRLEVNKRAQWLRSRGYEDRILPGSKANGGKILAPIPELALQVFREWVMRSGIRQGLLFQINGGLITYRQIESRYSQALKTAGLPFTATHILRHAALTEAYDTCKDLLLVQRLAGQRDLRSTTRYAKVRDHQLVETQKKMDEKLASILTK